MPPTKNERTSALAINVTVPQGTRFNPGEFITGNVFRADCIDSPNALLTIKLQGRSKALVVKVEYNGRSWKPKRYRSRFAFFEANRHETGQVLHQGPLQITTYNDLSRAWNFAIKIPYFTGLDLNSPSNDESTYIDMSPEAVAKHPLPPSFAPHNVGGFVEYYLEATLDYTDNSKSRTDKSFFVVPINMAPLAAPIYDWKPKLETLSTQAVSYFLVPGTQRDKMSFKKKTKQFFQTTSVPTLKYKVAVSTPSVVQLNHADCLPIYMKMTSDLDASNKELRELPFKAVITNIEIVARLATAIKADGMNYMSGEGKIEDDIDPVDLGLGMIWGTLREPIEIEVAPAANSVNVAAKLDLRLRQDGLYMGSQKLSKMKHDLVPSFQTYNISHSHSFQYTIKWKIADCEEEITFKTPVSLLPEAIVQQAPAVQAAPVAEL